MKKISNFLLLLLSLLSIGIIMLSFLIDSHEIDQVFFPKEWTHYENEDTMIFENTIPSFGKEEFVFSYTTNYQIMDLYLNDTLVFTNNKDNYFHNMTSNQLVRFALRSTDIGKTIRFQIKKANFQKNTMPHVSLVSSNDFLNSNFSYVVIPSFFSIIFILFGVIFLIYGYKNKSATYKKSYIFLGLFTFLSGILIFANNPYTNIYLGKYLFTTSISYLIIIIMSLLFMIFLKYYFNIKNKLFHSIYMFLTILSFVLTLLHLTGFKNFVEMSFFIDINIATVVLYAFAQFYKNMRINKSRDSKIIFTGFIMMATFMIISLIGNYIIPNFDQMAVFFVGLSIFLVAINVTLIGESVKEINITLLKRYAFFDELTNIKNRTAYENDIRNMSGPIIIAVFDVNYLKVINDQYGHLAGDELLKNCVFCIQNALNNYCFELYRIGGDEFVATIKGLQKDIPSIERKLKASIKKFNQSNHFDISIAYGFESFFLKYPNHEIFEHYFQLADQKMYENKIKYHNQRK